MLTFITPYDIARRLYFRKRYWFKGKPKIIITGNNNEFGKLIFDFTDDIIIYTVYLKSKSKILNIANIAINNYSVYLNDNMIYDIENR